MTALLQKAFTTASSLPRSAQEQLARQMLRDIAAELKWEQTFARSQHLLEKLASKARSAKKRGRTVHQGFDSL